MKFYKPLSLFVFVFVVIGAISCTKIAGEETVAEQADSFQIIEGACGEIIFEENIGTDSLSAVETVRQRKVGFLGHSNFSIGSTLLGVEGKDGTVPEEKFYALHILDEDGLHLHAVSEVITNEGDLFILNWCPD